MDAFDRLEAAEGANLALREGLLTYRSAPVSGLLHVARIPEYLRPHAERARARLGVADALICELEARGFSVVRAAADRDE